LPGIGLVYLSESSPSEVSQAVGRPGRIDRAF
jgi:hypothetical protein